MEKPRSAEETLAIFRLVEFQRVYMNRSPVIETRLGVEVTEHGSDRFFEAILKRNPTKEEQVRLNATFWGIPIRYVLETPANEPKLSVLDLGHGYCGV